MRRVLWVRNRPIVSQVADLGAKRMDWHGRRGLKVLSSVRQGT